MLGMTGMTVEQAYRKARVLFRVQRNGGYWRVLYWRRGLNCWEAHHEMLPFMEARQRCTQMIAATALIALGLDERQTAALMEKVQRGGAVERIRAALKACQP